MPEPWTIEAAQELLIVEMPEVLHEFLYRQEKQLLSDKAALQLPSESSRPNVYEILQQFLEDRLGTTGVSRTFFIAPTTAPTEVCMDRITRAEVFSFTRGSSMAPQLENGENLPGARSSTTMDYHYDLRDTLSMLLAHFNRMLPDLLLYPDEFDQADYVLHDCVVSCGCTGSCYCGQLPLTPSDVYGGAHLIRALQVMPELVQLPRSFKGDSLQMDAEGRTTAHVNKRQRREDMENEQKEEWSKISDSLIHYSRVFNDLLKFISENRTDILPPLVSDSFAESTVRRPTDVFTAVSCRNSVGSSDEDGGMIDSMQTPARADVTAVVSGDMGTTTTSQRRETFSVREFRNSANSSSRVRFASPGDDDSDRVAGEGSTAVPSTAVQSTMAEARSSRGT